MDLVSISLKQANEFVENLHRHHKKVQGHKFSIGAMVDGELIGVVICGRPVARMLDDGTRLEVTRLCTNGYKNACFFLYGAAARVAWSLGYKSIGTLGYKSIGTLDYKSIETYILDDELGTSLYASGWEYKRTTDGGSWSRPSRSRTDSHPTVPKKYYEKVKK